MKKSALQGVLNERLSQFKYNTAIEYGKQIITYRHLDKRSNFIANWLKDKGVPKETQVGIMLEDRAQLIMSIIGILKTGSIFVPLISDYPGSRLGAMIDAVDIKIIICDKINIDRFTAGDHRKKQVKEVILIDQLFAAGEPSWYDNFPDTEYNPEDKIYIYFTSGSTGKPKALVGKNKSLLHFINWEIETFHIGSGCRVSQLITPVFDAFLRDVFVPLCSGGVICIPGNTGIVVDPGALRNWIETAGVHLIHCVPSLFRLINSKFLTADNFKALQYILLSGEKINVSELVNWYDTFDDRIQLINLYGPTETTMTKTYYMIRKADMDKEIIPIGKPMKGCRIIVCDKNMNICDVLVTGEIYIRTPYMTFGYYNDAELTKKKFVGNPFVNDPNDLLYATGDLGRMLPDGNIELLGRIDRQIKMRGIRIELEEIESVLIRHPAVKEAAVIKGEMSSGSEYLCAYITTQEGNETTGAALIPALKDYLSGKLPDYMVPARIVNLNEIPRTPNGKVDYPALNKGLEPESIDLSASRDSIQQKLIQIWSEILQSEKIGINTSFFELGGNSLNIMSLLSIIQKEFDVSIPLGEIFENSTISYQAKIIRESGKEKAIPVETVEEKEYYVLSSAQERIYVLQQMEPQGTTYNIPQIFELVGEVDIKRIVETFNRLIERHESLRTSFVMINNEPFQKIHRHIKIGMEYHDSSTAENEIIKRFISPFDLSEAPLLRAGLVKTGEKRHIFMVDLHHIISDGVSSSILVKEFVSFYSGQQLPPLKTQYKDFAEWQARSNQSRRFEEQEKYWLKQFEGEIPLLRLPTDWTNPGVKQSKGYVLRFEIDKLLTDKINDLVMETGTTLYMVLFAVYNILLSKCTGQVDIIVGSPTAARPAADLQNVVGMFVNMLAMRNFPGMDKSFLNFLIEVKENALKAYENQNYPFEKLVKNLNLERTAHGNPLINSVFTMQNQNTNLHDTGRSEDNIPGLMIKPYPYEERTPRFDLTFDALEMDDSINFWITYSIALFNPSTIEKLKKYYLEILEQVIENIQVKIKNIFVSNDVVTAKSGILQEDVADFDF